MGEKHKKKINNQQNQEIAINQLKDKISTKVQGKKFTNSAEQYF
jgi:hypothetical protein